MKYHLKSFIQIVKCLHNASFYIMFLFVITTVSANKQLMFNYFYTVHLELYMFTGNVYILTIFIYKNSCINKL